MRTITVSGILTDGARLLLAHAPGSPWWSLPGGLLEDTDETVEDALVRTFATATGAEVTGHEFLDTVYERRGDEVLVHNVFLVTALAGGLPDTEGHGAVELHWADLDLLGDLPLPPWLAGALPALLAGGAAPPPAVDLAALAREVGAGPGAAFAQGAPATAGDVVIITGPAGAGKSTVARALCARFPRAAHIDVDIIRWRMVVSGFVRPEAAYGAGPEAEEARRQLALATRNACALARNFAAAGFAVVIDDVLEQPADLDRYLAELHGLDVACVTLLPDVETLRARDRGRGEDAMGERSEELRRIIAANGETRGLRLDTSGRTVEETVAVILERWDEARVAVPSAGA
jgi:ADP-ribose pyrophosphatase YjhB (NUDIX family)/chloramphenicol 3-O-phosphotransferase